MECRAGNGWGSCCTNKEDGCRAAKNGRYHAARNEAPYQSIPENSSASTVARSAGSVEFPVFADIVTM